MKRIPTNSFGQSFCGEMWSSLGDRAVVGCGAQDGTSVPGQWAVVQRSHQPCAAYMGQA